MKRSKKITVKYPDGSKLEFWGYIKGNQVMPTNRDSRGRPKESIYTQVVRS